MLNDDCLKIRNEQIENLIKENIGLVYTIVSRFSVSQFDKDDLVQAGLMGLEYAINHFQEDRGYKLSTYAVPFILGNIKKELKKLKFDNNFLKSKILDDCSLISTIKKEENAEEIIIQLAILEDDEQKIYHLKYQKNYTEKAIARIFGVNQSTISRKLKKIKEKMLKERIN